MRSPTLAEVIDLENWAIRLVGKRFRKADKDEENLDSEEWCRKYPELPYFSVDRLRLQENLFAVIELAREVAAHPKIRTEHSSTSQTKGVRP